MPCEQSNKQVKFDMIKIRTFQILIIAATACYIVWFFLPFWPGYLTDVEQRMTEVSGYGAVLPVQHPVYYGLWFGLWLIAALGLLFLKNWARYLYLVLSVLGCVSTIFSGFVVQPPLDTLFSTTNLILDGAILAIAYLSPFAARFKEVKSQHKARRAS